MAVAPQGQPHLLKIIEAQHQTETACAAESSESAKATPDQLTILQGKAWR